MAEHSDVKFKGVRKKESSDLKWAELTIRVNDMKRSRDVVTVTYPTDANSALIVQVNGTELYNRRLPAAILANKSKHEVKYGDQGKIVVKLRKTQPGRWIERWSPRRELPGPVAVTEGSALPCDVTQLSTSFSMTGSMDGQIANKDSTDDARQPIITYPDSENDDV